MVSIEFGNEHAPVILLLHGGGLSWWNFREAAALLAEKYHVILPILDGHAGSDRPFTTIEENAREIIAYIEERHGGSVLMIGGVSLGAQILTEMLSQKRSICRYAVIESALLLPMHAMSRLIPPTLLASYGLIRKPWFARLQFASLRIKPSLYADYYRDTCAITRENMTAFLAANMQYAPKDALCKTQASVHIWVGGRENGRMLRSAKLLSQRIPGSVLEIKQGLFHGEYALNHADAYAAQILQILSTDIPHA